MEIELNTDNFKGEVLERKQPILVDFWATWCGPCMMLAPELEKLAAEATDFAVGKVNVDENSALCETYGITVIPTLMLFADGEVVTTTQGYQTKDQLKQMVDSAL